MVNIVLSCDMHAVSAAAPTAAGGLPQSLPVTVTDHHGGGAAVLPVKVAAAVKAGVL